MRVSPKTLATPVGVRKSRITCRRHGILRVSDLETSLKAIGSMSAVPRIRDTIQRATTLFQIDMNGQNKRARRGHWPARLRGWTVFGSCIPVQFILAAFIVFLVVRCCLS